MRIIRGAITNLTESGYHTLQIPDVDIYIGTTNMSNTVFIDYPDEYFQFLKYEGKYMRIIFGKEKGFLHLSEEGWNYFRNDIQRTFNSNKGTRQDFLNHVDEHFRKIKEQTLLYKDKLREKLTNIERDINNLGW